MVRPAAVSVENNFSKGLITEATAMNYPENCVIRTANCVFSKEGKVIRRYGCDYEMNYTITPMLTIGPVLTAPTPSDYYSQLVVKEFEWTTVNSNGEMTLVVVQFGNILSFFLENADNTFSATRKTFTVDLTDYQVGTFSSDYGQFVGGLECSFASGFGYLFVAHPLCSPFYVAYDPDTDAITAAAIDLTIRDFERLNDTYAADFRPASLTDLHKYNIYNQGWGSVQKNADGTTIAVATYWDNKRSDFPSNADIWYLYKNTSDVIDSALFDTVGTGNTLAPQGHFTYDAFDIDRDTTLGTTGLPAVSAGDYRPAQVAFYAGRVWYAGVQATGYSGNIYFSKLVFGASDFGTCYQVADPTSENISDLQPTDGGVIVIPEIATVLKLVPFKTGLLIFATNGVWKIDGPTGAFAADDYAIKKISSVSTIAPNSVIVAEGIPMWWDKAGIYMMSFDQTSGNETVVNISETTIQSYFNAIPAGSLPFTKVAYNSINKTVQWIFLSQAPSTIQESYTYDTILVFNLATQAFSPQVLASYNLIQGPVVTGILFTANVHNDPLVAVESAGLTKLLTCGTISGADQGFTVSQFNSDTFLDWFSFDTEGQDFSSYFITGYRIRGDLLRKFQSNYIVVIMKTEDDASCYLQGIWDYSNTTDNGRLTISQQIYRDDSTYDYSRAKLKMRGAGKSLQFKFFSETGKPFTVAGWTTSDTGNVVP